MGQFVSYKKDSNLVAHNQMISFIYKKDSNLVARNHTISFICKKVSNLVACNQTISFKYKKDTNLGAMISCCFVTLFVIFSSSESIVVYELQLRC
jgi:hypothetical protein